MARTYNRPGGTLTITDPDPEEVALKRAQIAKLEQEPLTDRARLALEWLQEQRQAGTAAGQLGLGRGQLNLDTRKLDETLPIEKGKLTVDQQRAADESRFRTGSLAEETRFHKASNAAEEAKVKAGLVGDLITHVLPQEGVQGSGVAKGATMAAVGALGFPEISANMEAGQRRDLLSRAGAFATQNKSLDEKKFGALTADPSLDPTYVKVAWDKYKSLHPEVYGKEAATAAETALQPPAPATTRAPTDTGTFVAPGAGSPSVGWAMGPDSPRASETPGVSQFGPLKPQMGIVDPKNPSEVLPLPGREVAPPPPPVSQLLQATSTGPVQGPPMETTAAAPLPPPIAVRPPTVNVDQLLQNVVGGPTMEELKKRRLSQQAAVLTPFRTNQY